MKSAIFTVPQDVLSVIQTYMDTLSLAMTSRAIFAPRGNQEKEEDLAPKWMVDAGITDALFLYIYRPKVCVEKQLIKELTARGYMRRAVYDRLGCGRYPSRMREKMISISIKTGNPGTIELIMEMAPEENHYEVMVSEIRRQPTIPVLRWALDKKLLYVDEEILCSAIREKKEDVFLWALPEASENPKGIRWNGVLQQIAEHGGSSSLRALLDRGIEYTSSSIVSLMDLAAYYGQLDVMRVLCEYEVCTEPTSTVFWDAVSGRSVRIDVLEFLKNKGFPWDTECFIPLLTGDHHDVLRWMRAQTTKPPFGTLYGEPPFFPTTTRELLRLSEANNVSRSTRDLIRELWGPY